MTDIFVARYGLEELLTKYKVDVVIWAHEHYYERFWPLNDYRVMNGSRAEPYTNPKVFLDLLKMCISCKDQVYSSRRFQPVSASAQLGRMDRIFGRKSPFFVIHPFFFLPKKAEKAQRL